MVIAVYICQLQLSLHKVHDSGEILQLWFVGLLVRLAV